MFLWQGFQLHFTMHKPSVHAVYGERRNSLEVGQQRNMFEIPGRRHSSKHHIKVTLSSSIWRYLVSLHKVTEYPHPILQLFRAAAIIIGQFASRDSCLHCSGSWAPSFCFLCFSQSGVVGLACGPSGVAARDCRYSQCKSKMTHVTPFQQQECVQGCRFSASLVVL